jgi:hypothetical protein
MLIQHFGTENLHSSYGFLLGLLFDPEDGCDMFLPNVGLLSPDYMVVYQRRQNFIFTAART